MKQVFHKIMSMLMAFVVLCSTMSFTVDMHYCGDTLVETAVFHKTKGCGMEMAKEAPVSGCSITKKDCCSDKQLFFEGQHELKISFDTLSLDQQVFVASFLTSYLDLFEGFDEDVTLFPEYPPPLIVRQIYKLDETYLI
jgi:hypothetical protein